MITMIVGMSSLSPNAPRLEERLRALDDAFLFSLGATTFVFAILQTVVVGTSALFVFTPLLVSGLLYPFYVGFIRGAILYDDTPRERARGWLCFAVGVFYYFGLAPVVLGRDFFPQLRGIDLLTALIATVAGAFFARILVRWYFSMTQFHASVSDLLLLGASAGCTTMLCYFTFLLESYLYYEAVKPHAWLTSPLDVGGLVLLMWFLPGFVMLERVIHRVTDSNWALRELPGESMSHAAEEHVPWFGVLLVYLFSGCARCVLMGARSDKIAFAAYVVSFALTLPSLLNGSTGSIVGLVSLGLGVFACWRFLTCSIELR